MGTFADLSIRVTSFDRQPLEGAQVIVERGGEVFATGATDAHGRFQVERNDGADLVVRVDADGYAAQERVVTGDRPSQVELFMLGRPGMPFYYRRNVQVPFEPIQDAVGVLLRPSEAVGDDASTWADGVAARLGAGILRAGGNFARSGIAVIEVPTDTPGGGTEALLNNLAADEDVEQAGALVQLFEDNASFLTDTVIARFADEVDDAQVATIARRHSLTPGERIEALGNVYRLRFGGLASYAVLEASNGLAEEPEVVYAEPDLAHTVEQDQATPTDFLFPQQWDHPIIDTPGAWQVLRDIDPNRTFGSPDVIIAVVDTGVDTTHPEFTGTVSNGQPKLYQAFNFTNMVANTNNLGGDHGTACASAATAYTNNASTVPGVTEGIAGVAGNCRLLAVRHGGLESRFAQMYLWTAGLDANSSTAGFPARITPGADVITNSFGFSIGSPISGLMSDTFDALTDIGRGGAGTLLFFSAGNANADLDLTFARPWGMYDRCFCVAASTLADDGITEIKAGYSSFGSTVDFCAPSSDTLGGIHNPPRGYGAQAATIQAAPAGDALPGRSDRSSTLSAASAAGATTVILASAAGMSANQALLVGTPGVAGTENRRITAVNAATNQVTVALGLSNAHGLGTPVAAGPRSYQSNFGGTSYATPVCAGTGALMLSVDSGLRWDQIRDILRDTATKIDPNNTHPTGRWRDGADRISTDPGYTGSVFSEFYGFGRIDADAAVEVASRYTRAWVYALYADLLGRAPDAGGLAYWVGQLQSGQSRESVANGFLASQEYCTAIITGLYQQLLGRAPDAGGLAWWVNTLQNGTAFQQIVLGFCDSAEYQNGNPPPAQFVESLYERLLGRASDPAGKQGWIDALQAGQGTSHVINGFLNSQEYCTNKVTGLYLTLLGRQPDAAGLTFWVNALTGGTPFQQIQLGFLTSPEYQTRALTRFP
jgi:subtilisin family serine protease